MTRCAIVVGLALSLWAAATRAQDFDEYTRLLESANAAHDALEQATPGERGAKREDALAADLAVIDWLEAFFATDAFAALPEDARALARQDRYRQEFNASQILIDLDRCGEARDRIRSLLDGAIDDAELRPLLTESYERAVECANRPRTATLRVNATPGDAELVVDGVAVGSALQEHEVAAGPHTLVVRAPGHASEETSFVAGPGDVVSVGPITLVAIASEVGKPPSGLEWALWGVGAAATATGLVLLLSGLDLQDQIDMTEETPAPGEQDRADTFTLAGAAVGGAGIVSILTGTLLYVLRDAPASADDTGSRSARASVGITLRF